jgi:hypothetical protein
METLAHDIYVPEDLEGLHIAAMELLEGEFNAPERQRLEQLAEVAANRETILASLPAIRTLSPGYYMWLDYIVSTVEPAVEAGVWAPPGEMDADEFAGLQVIREARGEFHRKHPPCKVCGKPLPDLTVSKCSACEAAEFRAASLARR